MTDKTPLSPGWYLGLRYMSGRGLVARLPEAVEARQRSAAFIFAEDVLAKAADWKAILADWWDALAVGGHLILWLKDCRHIEPDKAAARLTLDDVVGSFDMLSGWQLCEADVIDGHAYIVWKKHADKRQMRTPWLRQPKHLLVARTGAYGDALMAASILPHFKDEGWYISFISRPSGAEALRHDPHIDEIITLENGQTTPEELPHYWRAWEKRVDRFINLTHSVEGELLKQPGRADYFWPAEQRRAACDRSYLAHTHLLAKAPGPYRVCFYPVASETIWAEAQAKLYGNFALWCLRGSAVHKWWPYTPQVICRLLAKTDLNFVLAGDAEAAPLAEAVRNAAIDYFGDARRIHIMCGSHSIREIMALAHFARVVVGPETGTMHAVSMQTVPKILLLSHSSPKNLSEDWINTTALEPLSPCYPCHRLHYGHEWCPQDQVTEAALCAASISVERVLDAVMAAARGKAHLPWWRRGTSVASAT
jgi:ADP-heptose:LPS heptosyltransferase